MKPAHRYATATAFRITLEARLKSLAQAEGIDLQRLRRRTWATILRSPSVSPKWIWTELPKEVPDTRVSHRWPGGSSRNSISMSESAMQSSGPRKLSGDAIGWNSQASLAPSPRAGPRLRKLTDRLENRLPTH